MSKPGKRNLYTYMNNGSTPPPFFEKMTLEEKSSDGYWVSAVDVNGDGKLDLITSGLAEGKVVWYENPTWKKHLIAEFPGPVALDHGNIEGVYYYKIINLEQGLIERWRVSTVSTSLIAVGDFDGDGRLDFATTSYYTPGFFLCDLPQINVFYNRFAPKPPPTP